MSLGRPIVRLGAACAAPFRAVLSGVPIGYALMVVVVLHSTLYWMGAAYQEPDTPLAVHVMYRPEGDTQYLPYIRLYGDGRFSEGLVVEKEGSEALSLLQVLPLLPHAVLFRWFGAAGFVAADALFAAFYYLVLTGLLRVCGVKPWLGAGVAFVVAMRSGLNMFLQVSRLVVDLMPFNRFWDVRIVRPYVTEPFVVAVLLGVLGVVFLPDRWRRYRPWVLIGAAEAVLVQSDIHSAMTLCMSAGMIAVWLLAVRREDRLSIAKRLLASTAAVSVLCVPFFIQRCVEHPGVPARVGAFPVTPRTALAFLVEMREPTHALGGLAALLGTAGLLWSLDSSGEATGRVRVMATLAGILVCSCLALPLSALVLGRTAQPDHFEMSRFVLTGYGLVVALTYLAQRLLDAVTARSSLGGAHAALAGIAGPGLMALLCLLGVKGFVISAHDSFCRMDRGHVRTDFQEYRSLRDYRQDFKALLSELERPAYADCRVLATFDHQAYAWWASFRRGHVFNPDPVNTSLCDAEIERRLVLFCRTLGMTPDQFVAFLERPYVNIFWLGGNKYQASRAYTFAPLDQYTEEQQAQIARTTLQCNWNVLVPEGEKRRLRDLYVNMPVEPAMPRLDAVILTNDESLAPFSPPEAEYKRTWQSRSLRVFVNRRLTR